ncbi:DUF4148 domain-containing protein [Paraburkholderia tropica]|uniref:DUF4148 domain-containing protein n=1 Tax=Paraburkholderia tropica TaxID=92647 RepID=UPI003D284B84
MKKITLSLVSVMMLASAGAFAQTAQPATASSQNGPQLNQAAPLSREQVNQELVASRNDGSLARINKLYAHH